MYKLLLIVLVCLFGLVVFMRKYVFVNENYEPDMKGYNYFYLPSYGHFSGIGGINLQNNLIYPYGVNIPFYK